MLELQGHQTPPASHPAHPAHPVHPGHPASSTHTPATSGHSPSHPKPAKPAHPAHPAKPTTTHHRKTPAKQSAPREAVLELVATGVPFWLAELCAELGSVEQ